MARLRLPGGAVLSRAVMVEDGRVEVVDRLEVGEDATVRWTVADPFEVSDTTDGTELRAEGRWTVRISHPGDATVRAGRDGDPSSGWVSPTYALRNPVQVVEVPLQPGRPTVTVFSTIG